MLLEWGIPVSSYETNSAPLSVVLGRFVKEAERARLLELAQVHPVVTLLTLSENLRFISRTPPLPKKPLFHWDKEKPGCPHLPLVILAAHLVGKTNAPAEYNRFLEVYCGTVAKSENSIGFFGPLSGREGTDYTPFSRCWSSAKELYRLVEFMKTPEKVPQIPERKTGLDEEGLRQLLNQRERAKSANAIRGQVIAHWQGLRGYEASGQPLLPPPQEETESDIPPDPRIIYDATVQVDLESPEYRQIVTWVEGHVLTPLLELVDKLNLQVDLEHIYVGAQHTAANCPVHPRGGFVGAQSLLASPD